MDDQGRLHYRKKNGEDFVGLTKEETGLDVEAEWDEAVALRSELEGNRHERRKKEALARLHSKMKEQHHGNS